MQPTGISEEVFRQIETVQNRYDSSTAEAFRVVQKSGEMVVRTLDPRQFIRLASETVPKINIDSNVSAKSSKAITISDSDIFCHLHTSKHIYYENFFCKHIWLSSVL